MSAPMPCDKPDCSETIEDLYTFLDGELTEEKRVRITAHLDNCPPCVGAYDFESELRVIVSARCHDRVPEDLRRRIEEVLETLDG